jgi:hypothetical protein
MKINGKTIKGPNVEIIAIPRSNGDDIIFHAQAVLSMEDFHKMVPEPVPPYKTHGDGTVTPEFNSPKYKEKMSVYNQQINDYMLIKSLSATPGLEWETVDIDNPETWHNIHSELKSSDLTDVEIQRIMMGAINANGLSEARVEEARKRFLASRAAVPEN